MTELDRTAQTIRLHDGRTLAFAEYGDRQGRPVFYFTGGNSSRLEGAWFDEVAHRRGVRLIATDRPGFGLSSYQLNRTFLDWPDDIRRLADALRISTFAVFGLSGGGPHVAALAYKMQERLSAAAIVSSPCPYGSPHMFDGMWLPIRLMYFVARHAPSWLNERVQSALSNPDMLIENIDRLPNPDAELLRNAPHLADRFRLSQIESLRNGAQGAAHEWRLYTRP